MESDYNQENFKEAEDIVIKTLFSRYSGVQHPHAMLICAQPGAGKSFLVNSLQNKNIAFVNGDEFRVFHTHRKELIKSGFDNYIESTREFNGKMTEAVIDKLSDKKVNMIIEGTMRQYHVPVNTKNALQAKGYHVSLNVLAVSPLISYLRIHKRYVEMKKIGLVPRKTNLDFHEKAVKAFVQNFKKIYSSEEFEDINIFKESNCGAICIYSSIKTPNMNPIEVLEAEINRRFSAKEIDDFINKYSEYVPKEKIKALFNKKKSRIGSMKHHVSNFSR